MKSLSSPRLTRLPRPTFLGRLYSDGIAEFINTRTRVGYGLVPCFRGGYWLTRGVSLLSPLPMPRGDAVCLIELDAYAR